jgi:hypothetical protein
MESRIGMSQRERDILKIMSTVLQGKRTQSEVASGERTAGKARRADLK